MVFLLSMYNDSKILVTRARGMSNINDRESNYR